MKTLIVVHLEPDFDSTGDLEILANKIVRYSNFFDRVINLTSANALTGTPPFPRVAENFWDNREWIWGLDLEGYQAQGDGHLWVEGQNYIPTTGHTYSEILDWMHKLSRHDHYSIVGGARHECLQDIADIWEFLKLPFTINESLTYG